MPDGLRQAAVGSSSSRYSKNQTAIFAPLTRSTDPTTKPRDLTRRDLDDAAIPNSWIAPRVFELTR